MSAQTPTPTTQDGIGDVTEHLASLGATSREYKEPDVRQLAEALLDAAARLVVHIRWDQEKRSRTERAAKDDAAWAELTRCGS